MAGFPFLEQFYAAYESVGAPVRAFGAGILDLANPALDRSVRAAATAPVNIWGTLEFDVALWITLAYLLVVMGGTFLMPAAAPGGKGKPAPKEEKAVKPLAQKFKDEPILYPVVDKD